MRILNSSAIYCSSFSEVRTLAKRTHSSHTNSKLVFNSRQVKRLDEAAPIEELTKQSLLAAASAVIKSKYPIPRDLRDRHILLVCRVNDITCNTNNIASQSNTQTDIAQRLKTRLKEFKDLSLKAKEEGIDV